MDELLQLIATTRQAPERWNFGRIPCHLIVCLLVIVLVNTLSAGQTACSMFNVSKSLYHGCNGSAGHVNGMRRLVNGRNRRCRGLCGTSSIILDTTGKGFHMSDPNKNWVAFDLRGNGTFERFSWPEHGSGNAWLIYDVNDDGVITNGKEMFGNFTPHSDGGVPHHPDPSGFLALAWYDKRAQGGNGDLVLDEQDAIWNHLKLWIDDHCYLTPNDPCTSVPSEIHSLESAGIHNIALVYEMNPATNGGYDAYGNDFNFYVVVNAEPQQDEQNTKDPRPSKDPRLMYEVFLRVADQ